MANAKHKQLFKQCGAQDQMFNLHSVLHLCQKRLDWSGMAAKADFQTAMLIPKSLHVGIAPSTPPLLF